MPKVQIEQISGADVLLAEFFEDERGGTTSLLTSLQHPKGHPSQILVTENTLKSTLRGMHLQRLDFPIHKYVSCIQGSIYDVIVDLRETSPTFKCWASVELSEDNKKVLSIPNGVAHGYLTQTDEAKVFYLIIGERVAESEMVLSFADKDVGVTWPSLPMILSEKDTLGSDLQTILKLIRVGNVSPTNQ